MCKLRVTIIEKTIVKLRSYIVSYTKRNLNMKFREFTKITNEVMNRMQFYSSYCNRYCCDERCHSEECLHKSIISVVFVFTGPGFYCIIDDFI